MAKEKINWREVARELTLDPQSMGKVFDAIGEILAEKSPELKKAWDKMNNEEKYLRVITYCKNMDDKQNTN